MSRAHGTRPSAPTRRSDGASGASGRGRGVGGAGPSRSQVSDSTATHSRPDSSSRARRPLSSDSEEEVEQPKKKKKKRIVDPDKDGIATAQTRVKLADAPPPTQSRRVSYPSGSAYRDISRGSRRVTLDIASLDKEKGKGADRQRLSASRPSTPNRPAPPASASVPLPRPATLKASRPASSTGNRRTSAPVAPPQREVIEILDSDDEYVLPSKASPPPPKQPSPKPSSDRPLPRRRTIQSRKASSVSYKEENGVIILDSDDDVVMPPAQASRASTSQHKEPPRVSPTPPAAASAAQAPISQHKDGSPVRRSPSVVGASIRSPSPDRPTSVRASPTSPAQSPEQASSPAIAIEQDDVPMLDDDPIPGAPEETIADVEMDDDDAADVPPPKQSQQSTDQEQNLSTDEAVGQIDLLVSFAPAPEPQSPRPATTSPSPPGEESPTREGTAPPEIVAPTSRTVSPPEHESELDVAPAVAAPKPSHLAGATKALITRLSSVVLSAEPDPIREGTASPVSSMLDPRLQDLAISGTPMESSASPAQSSSSNPPFSPSASRTRSPKPASASPVRRIRLTKLLYSGNDGFFKDMLRVAQKRRSSSHQSGAPSSSLSRTTSARISPSTSTTSARMSPKPFPTPTTTSVSTSAFSEPAPQQPVGVAAVTTPPNPEEDNSTIEPVLPQNDSATQYAMELEREQARTLPSDVPEASIAIGHTGDRQEGTAADANVGQVPALQEPVATVADDTAGRVGTPPVEPRSTKPLGLTLSEIIRKARNQKAREEPIDLTGDDEPVAQANDSDSQPHVQGSLSAPPTTEPTKAPPPATLQPVRQLDLIRLIREKATSARRESGSTQRSPLDVQLPPLKGKAPALPLPRNFRRVSTSSETPIASAGSSSELPETARTSHSVPPVPASSFEPRSIASSAGSLVEVQDGPFRHVLPRRNAVRPPHSAPPPITIRIPPLSRPSSTGASPLGTTSQKFGHVEPNARMDKGPTEPVLPLEQAATPPMSPTEATDEEECRHSLLYPSTTPEDSPEVEIPDEDEHPVRPLSGGRNRGQASSEASSSASGPRRSARLSSGSANSSVEPMEESEEPRRPLRRREPIVRTPSEEDVASQGGISRNSKYAQAFEEAGFGSISWRKDKRRIAKEFAPITQLAEDIPHDLHDRLNSLPPSARRAGNMQVLIFEAEIRANTAEDEPNAPPIRIINNVDDEPTPPLEFFYSNLMWHGKGVPKPDYDALEGCGCNGPCDPSSKTCACVKRQKQFLDGGSGFLYDKKGKVKEHERPIFECNMNCGCSDDCPNRVVQHGRQYEIMIQKTPNKGWGVFAGSKKIPANTYIGVYAGEYLMDADGEARGKIYNKFGRTYLFDVDFWHIKKHTGRKDVRYCIDAYHAGNFTRYLNHSCDPNCAIIAAYINEANIEKPLLAIFTKRDIEPYDELCFSYMGPIGDSDSDSDSESDDDDDGAPKTYNGGVYVKCQCGAPNCCGKMWK